MQKQARQLNIESDSKKFVDALRSFWMPRLIQKMEQNSISSSVVTSHNSANSSSQPNLSQTVSPHLPNTETWNMDSFGENSNFDAIPNDMFSDFMTLPPLSETWDYPKNSFNTFNSTICNDQLFPGCNKVDGGDNFVEGFHLEDAMSATAFCDASAPDFQVAENEWVNGNTTDSLWSMDDIWQSRD